MEVPITTVKSPLFFQSENFYIKYICFLQSKYYINFSKPKKSGLDFIFINSVIKNIFGFSLLYAAYN